MVFEVYPADPITVAFQPLYEVAGDEPTGAADDCSFHREHSINRQKRMDRCQMYPEDLSWPGENGLAVRGGKMRAPSV